MTDLARIKYGFVVVLVGLAAVVFIYTVAIWHWTAASDVTAAVGSAGGVIGTIVGAFFGLQLGAAGKEKAEEQRDRAELQRDRVNSQLRELLAITPPATYEGLRAVRADLFGPGQ
jgi:hypothetical protein